MSGEKAADVAAELNISVNAVYLAKSTVLRRLRKELGLAGRFCFFPHRFCPFLSTSSSGLIGEGRAAPGESGVNHTHVARLTSFGQGKLYEDEAEEIADHLAGCATCRAFLDNLSDVAFLALIRPLFTPGPQTHSSAPASSFEPAGRPPPNDHLPQGEVVSPAQRPKTNAKGKTSTETP
jgi:hypothetical protein